MVSKSRKVFAPDLDIRDQFSIALIHSGQHKPENPGNGGPGASQQNLQVAQCTPSRKTTQENHQSRVRPALDKVAGLASDSANHGDQGKHSKCESSGGHGISLTSTLRAERADHNSEIRQKKYD
jgi:hypothetical protein